jgi:cyclophilin family peptidyl-prolyl cis-trans isomerase
MLAGTVIMVPNGRPPANGSIFAILLAPRPDYEGTATGFAQVIDGLDVVKKISQVPATAREAAQPHRPIQPVRINRIIIKPKVS